MKKTQIIALVLGGLAAAVFLLWPIVWFDVAKYTAIEKFSSYDRRVLDCTPSLSVLSIPRLNITSSYLIVHAPGCDVGLPKSEFQRDAAHKIVFTNNNMLVACCGTMDKTNYILLEQQTGRTNVFDFVSSAYFATVTGISEQRNMAQLRQYLALLLYKSSVAPVGFQHSWLRFDRGDLSGFITGNMQKDREFCVEIYLRDKDEFLTIGIWRRGSGANMADIYHILSVITVRPNPT